MLVGRDSSAAVISNSRPCESRAKRSMHPSRPRPGWCGYPLPRDSGSAGGGVATLAFSNSTAQRRSGSMRRYRASGRAHRLRSLRASRWHGAASRLIVTPDDVRGNLDDGALESAAIAAARTRLAARRRRDRHRFARRVERAAARDRAASFRRARVRQRTRGTRAGAGAGRPARDREVDHEPEEDSPAAVPGSNVSAAMRRLPRSLAPRGACVVIVTHSHPLDLELVFMPDCLRDDWTYVGLIGSKASARSSSGVCSHAALSRSSAAHRVPDRHADRWLVRWRCRASSRAISALIASISGR